MENQELRLCACCAHNYELEDTFCNSCGFPLKGNQQEQDNYIANRSIKEIDLVDLNKKVETARTSLYWIAGILVVSTILGYFTLAEGDDLFAFLLTSLILVGAFLAFAVWGKTKPAAALISGLSLYIVIQILNFVANPATIFSGIIFKILIIGYLIKGLMAVLEVEKIKKELNIK